MQIKPIPFGLACALSASILWLVCSFFVMTMPSVMLSMSGHMSHMDFVYMGWHLTFSGVFKGLVGWYIAAGISGWLLAAIYNCLLSWGLLDKP